MTSFAKPGLNSGLIAITSILLLTSCASQPIGKIQGEVNLLISTNRFLTLEPCGCSLGPTGGLVREAEYVKREKAKAAGDTLILTGGISFKPVEGVTRVPSKQSVAKAETLIQGLNLLGTQGLGLVSEDFYLGLDKLKALSLQAKFPIVATNLSTINPTDSFWKPYYVHEARGYTVVVLSVATAPKQPVPGVRWTEPKSAIKAVLEQLPEKKNRLIVMLSSLGQDEVKELIKEIPEINIVAGSRDLTSLGVSHLTRSTLYTNSVQEGRKIANIKIQFHEGLAAGLYNAETAGLYKSAMQSTVPEIENIERTLASAPKRKRKELEARLSELKNFMLVAQAIPLDSGPELADYVEDLAVLDSSWDPQGVGPNPNPMEDLIQAYKTKVRELSMLEDGE